MRDCAGSNARRNYREKSQVNQRISEICRKRLSGRRCLKVADKFPFMIKSQESVAGKTTGGRNNSRPALPPTKDIVPTVFKAMELA